MYVQVCPFRCYYLKVFWLVGVSSWKLWLKPLLTAAPPPAAVNRSFDQGMFGSHVLATKCTKIWMMHECCLGSRTWEGRDVRKRRYVNKKIFQGLKQTVFIAILLASTGIPMHTSWCNLARNTSYCTRWAYLILDPNIGKKPYVAVRY